MKRDKSCGMRLLLKKLQANLSTKVPCEMLGSRKQS